MIALLPIGIAGPAGAPEPVLPPRPAPATGILIAALAAVALLDLLAGGRALHAWPVMPERVARAWLDLSGHLPLYQDPELFAPWQLWTAALLHDGWFGRPGAWFFTAWQLAADLAVALVAGRALERALGSASFAALLLLLAPLAGAIHLRHPGTLALGTAAALAVALAAAAWGFFLAHRLRASLVYWMVVAVGAVPFHLHLRWLALLATGLELARLVLVRAGDLREQAVGLLAALLLGFALGAGARLLTRPR
jgi:hypothetical protein